GAAGKIGGTEIKVSRVYLRRRDADDICHNFGHYTWWAHVTAGIYPPDPSTLSRFCREYLKTLEGLDLLAVWYQFGEAAARRRYAPRATLCALSALEPYYHARPWSAQLAGKRVVVVSPFERSIRSQYERREKIWAAKPDLLPEFDLRIVRCPQPAGIIDQPEYADWFVALQALKAQLGAHPFDVAIIGAGAWSIPLAVYAKSLGAFGIHLGGTTQLLFGIMGGRWDSNAQIGAFVNDSWTRPADDERPSKYRLHENGSYW
ncbi:MAG TPA: hypothetical protein VNF29_14145, partial [Candidatus Binataceae bacterium]|nr:hypothetical protein [Candidatus Binataceae bacterium]